MFKDLAVVFAFATAFQVVAVNAAERHTIHFKNRCGRGTPTLVRFGQVLSTGADYTSNGPFVGGIAYLQTGSCKLNGEGCGTIEMSLLNPTRPGSGSTADISLIPPLAYNGIPLGFGYYGGCDGAGARCSSSNCNTAFHTPDDTYVQVACQQNNVNLVITFC